MLAFEILGYFWLNCFSTAETTSWRIRSHRGLETLHYVAVAVHEELGEVPLDVAGDLSGRSVR